nr:Chain E, DNA polymerase III subunit alpha peptide [Mycobacterium tuberculosis]8DJQ_F Chain F, DNA polymerase III subunit alpha peptide [Mycobacterium tuberculosis]8DJQ_G Chain G, DNA polymerase III subunit alpha peptide [Mycobacterium tuberculosis]8DJQ_H Chain H, DNA polymerase III subunit alpha peptide [Mycobacterium tuberculosis]
QFDLFG